MIRGDGLWLGVFVDLANELGTWMKVKVQPVEVQWNTAVLALRRGDHFHSNETVRFDPPRASVTHIWSDPHTGKERRLKYHLFFYFVPEDANATSVVTFGLLKIGWPVFRHFAGQMSWLFRRRIRQALDEDAFILDNLADKSPDLAGMKLSRFDKVLGLNRDRIERIYRGNGRETRWPGIHWIGHERRMLVGAATNRMTAIVGPPSATEMGMSAVRPARPRSARNIIRLRSLRSANTTGGWRTGSPSTTGPGDN